MPFGVVQIPVPLPAVIVPVNPAALFAQAIASGPAFATGGKVMVNTTVSATAIQFPLLAEVKINKTDPERISEALGV